MRLHRRTTVQVGRLGKLVFSAGSYAYVGSAHGRGGLGARLKHHLGRISRPHWHIDYFKNRAPIVEIWAAAHGKRQECRWAQALQRMAGATMPAPGFGASDCGCKSHLVYFPVFPRLADFNLSLEKTFCDGTAQRISAARKTKRGGTDGLIDAAP